MLLAGASGGFRIAEAARLGAAEVRALEPEPVLFAHPARRHRPGRPGRRRRRWQRRRIPAASAGTGSGFDIVDLSADFLDAAETNARAFSREAIAPYLRVLAPGGMVSVPVSIRDFPVYALRMLATVRAALRRAGVDDPAAHVLVYRSAWNVRILIARTAGPPRASTTREEVLRRPVVRHGLVSRHRRRRGAGQYLQRLAGGLLRQGRGRIRRPGRRHRR